MTDENTNGPDEGTPEPPKASGGGGGPQGTPPAQEPPDKEGKLFRPQILLGVGVPGAVFATLVVIWVLWPIQSVQTQTGYRGTGMVQFTPEEDAALLAALNEIPENLAGDPIVPEPDEPLMKDLDYYENVKVLGDLTEANFNRLMAAMTEWVSPNQPDCSYCHYQDEDGVINFADERLYTKHVARRMIQMTQHINENWQSHVKQTGVTCYTCHRGQPVPQYHWYTEARPEGAARMGDNTMLQNRSDATVGYSSLYGDPLTKFLLEGDEIRVGDEFPRAPSAGSPTIQDTEWTYGLMFHFSSSLGVNCTFCHNSRAWNQWDQSPPARANAWYAIRMLRDVNRNYMHNLDVYPTSRLGPTGDAPKANCTTCHQGVNKPLYGVSMLEPWPELKTTGAPVYEPEESAEAPAMGEDERADAGTVSPN